ncbi:MAG TPA: M56 family metallopeptidase [Pirellulaceae bacterium]|nr:M56 family metallopeptidase [Pirellulaceae bacterium]HMO93063.1 M56 family metallopeptidase [Pirellulaceae bacterium]HMP69693.1 M56 family metallopeptidase [Pirellulaceae bacterium]
MNSIWNTFVQHPIAEVLGWTLVHSLWQGAAVAFLLYCGLRLLRRNSATTRYALSCACLAMMALLPVATLLYLLANIDHGRWRGEQTVALSGSAITSESSDAIKRNPASSTPDSDVALSVLGDSDHADGRVNTGIRDNWMLQFIAGHTNGLGLARWMPLLSAFWIVGVIVFSVRLLGALWHVTRLRRRGQPVVDSKLIQLIEQLSRRLGMRSRVGLLQSVEISVPCVVGFWRPVVIVPLSVISAMTTNEVESILAHELAHIRRHDWLMNLVQTLVETLLFYHPAAWWTSRVIRLERENCCDDLALTVCGDRLALAKALARLEETRCSAALAVSSSGGALVDRIRRIALPQDIHPATKWQAGLLVLSTALLTAGGLWISSSAARVPTLPNTLLPVAATSRLSENVMRNNALIPAADKHENLGPIDDTEQTGSDDDWGMIAELSGLQSRLTLQTARPQVGQPLKVKLELRNAGDKPTQFDPQNYVPFRVLRAERPHAVEPPAFIGLQRQTSGQKVTLEPGEVRLLWEDVDVGELFLLSEAREYEIFASGGKWATQTIHRDSNRLRVTLETGTLPPRQELIAALLSVKPEDWTLSVGVSEFYLMHAPTNLKQDITSVTVRYATDKLPDDFSLGLPVPGEDKVFAQANVDYLGETALGHTYVLSLPRSTKALWPDYSDKIAQAVKSIRK